MLDGAYITDAERRARRFQGAWYGTSGSLAADVIRLLQERKQLMSTVTELEQANAELRRAVEERLAATPADDPKMAGYTPMAASLAGCPPAQAAAAACLSDPKPSDIYIAPPITPEQRAEIAEKWKAYTEASAAKYHAEREQPTDEQPDADYILRGERELKDAGPRCTGDGVMGAPADGLRPGSREFLALLDELRDLHLRKTLDYGVDEDALSNIRSSADIVGMEPWAGCVLRMMDKMHRLKSYFRRGRVEFDGLSDTLKDIACYAVIAEVLRREGATDRPISP